MMSISPEWVEALAAVAVTVLTLLTLIVLKDYAKDTKKIAKASVHQADISVQQTEDAQKPFVALIEKPGDREARFSGGWCIENQGFGPALKPTPPPLF
jgi:hypothetical protein